MIGLRYNLPIHILLEWKQMLAIIGGTGLGSLEHLTISRRQIIRTPYGEPSGPITFGEIGKKTLVFLARHGNGHTIPPHGINYRANIWALKSIGVNDIVAVATVGGIHSGLGPGTIAVPNQIIDYTYGRKNTYFDGLSEQSNEGVTHIDFTEPYSQTLRALILQAASTFKEPVMDGSVYAAVQGPRLETASEINRLERDGADIVGMTGMPEAALAREQGINYAAICPVANHAAGRGSSAHGIKYEEIGAVLDQTMNRVCKIIAQVVKSYGD
jgi:5'-methylthioadenosine phosphorylase